MPHDPPHAPRDLGGHYDPSEPDRPRWATEQDPLFQAIFARYPSAREFSPCDCGLAAAVIPRSCFKPGIHYLIDDAELLAIAQKALVDTVYSNWSGPDAVLVLGERA